MAKRSDHPLKTLVKLAVLGVLAWLAYEYLYVQNILAYDTSGPHPVERLEKIREAILEEYRDEECLVSLERPMYRARAKHYRVNLTLDDGCHERARGLCREVGELVAEHVDDNVGVFAFDQAGNFLTKYLD